MSEPPKDVSVAIKWQGKLFSVTLAADADVGSLKRLIEAETNVLPARQKLLNVKVGPKMADDAAPLSRPCQCRTQSVLGRRAGGDVIQMERVERRQGTAVERGGERGAPGVGDLGVA